MRNKEDKTIKDNKKFEKKYKDNDVILSFKETEKNDKIDSNDNLNEITSRNDWESQNGKKSTVIHTLFGTSPTDESNYDTFFVAPHDLYIYNISFAIRSGISPLFGYTTLDVVEGSPIVTDSVNNPFTVSMEGGYIEIDFITEQQAYRIYRYISPSQVELETYYTSRYKSGTFSYTLYPISIGIKKEFSYKFSGSPTGIYSSSVLKNGCANLPDMSPFQAIDEPKIAEFSYINDPYGYGNVPAGEKIPGAPLKNGETLGLELKGDITPANLSNLQNLSVTVTYVIKN